MFVRPESRRSGVGKMLVEEFIVWGQSAGAEKVFVEHFYANDSAASFYKSCGFNSFSVQLER